MLPPEVAALIGVKNENIIMVVEEGMMRAFADAVGDRDPIYWK